MHATMANVATDYLLERLTNYGNQVSPDHETALRGLLWLAEAIIKGNLTGRFRFGLPCGMGKTTAVRSFIRATYLASTSFDNNENTTDLLKGSFKGLGGVCSIVVACSKVEQLCALKRQLIAEEGIPADRVGLMHSFLHDPKRADQGHDGYASEPSEGHDRQFLLVTHANVKAGRLKPWMADRANALMFFDESLVVSESLTLPLLNDSRHSLAF